MEPRSDLSACRACGTTWPPRPRDAVEGPEPCPHCGSTDVGPFDPGAAPFPHQPNPEMLHLQYLTPRPPPVPGDMVRMGPYMPLPKAPASPARWAEDPTGRNQWRFWNGTAWTEHVANDGTASRDPLHPDPPR